MADSCDTKFLQRAAEALGRLQKEVSRANIRWVAQMDQLLAAIRDQQEGKVNP